jgi:Protein of unknown function (DUF1236)
MKTRALPIIAGTVLLAAVAGLSFASAQMGNPGNAGAPNDATRNAGSDTGLSGAIEQKPLLTPAQRSAIYAEVSKDTSKSSPKEFSAVIGADVPPMIELYTLPDDALAAVPAAKLYKYTVVENKVVVVDPTKMRIIDVIGPPSK